MRRIIVTMSLALLAISPLSALGTAGKATHRFADGAKLVAEDIEYISAKSSTIFKVWYNLYIHPPLAKAMTMPPLTDDYVKAEKRITEQGLRICETNKKTDFCTVYFWTNLAAIPTLQEATEEELAKAPGILKIESDSHRTFEWFNTASTQLQNDNKLENHSGETTP